VFPTVHACSRYGGNSSRHGIEGIVQQKKQASETMLISISGFLCLGKPFWNLFHLQAMRDQNVSFYCACTEGCVIHWTEDEVLDLMA
jgi:hypothetical protein